MYNRIEWDSAASLFANDHALTSVSLQDVFNYGGDVSNMFAGCENLTSIDFSDLSGNQYNKSTYGMLPPNLKTLNLTRSAYNHDTVPALHTDMFANMPSGTRWNGTIAHPGNNQCAYATGGMTSSQLADLSAQHYPWEGGTFTNTNGQISCATVNIYANGGTANHPSVLHVDTANQSGYMDLYASNRLSSNRYGGLFRYWSRSSNGPQAYGSGGYYLNSGDNSTYSLYAIWGDVPTPGGVTAAWSHATGKVTLSGTGLPAYTQKINFRYWPDSNAGTAFDTGWISGASAQVSDTGWTPGKQWQARVQAQVQDPITGNYTYSPESSTDNGKGILPWMTVSYDKNGATGSSPGTQSMFVDTSYNTGHLTMPHLAGMTPPAGKMLDGWQTAADGGTQYAGTTDVSTSTGTTDANNHTALTLYARWIVAPVPTGVTARYSHTDNRIYLTTTGLDYRATSWNIRYKPDPTSSWLGTTNTSTRGETYSTNPTDPGTAWTVQAQAIYPDGTSSWSSDFTGTLPWMTVSFDKGTATGTAPSDKNALVDTSTNKATLTIPGQGSMTAPNHAWPDFTGWKNKTGTLTWQPGPTDIPTNVDGATTGPDGHTTLTLTAQWHTVTAPTGLTAVYRHTDDKIVLTGTSDVASGDKITACMTEGTGDTACQPAITAPGTNSAWQWTVTFPSNEYTDRYGYGHQHHFTAKLTENNADSATTDLQGTLPWMTISYQHGEGATGTTPDTNALTDTATGKATITIPGPDGLTHPHMWLTGWQNTTGGPVWQPGSRDIPTNTDGATTGPDEHTTLTLTAQWRTVTAPTGITARYSHADYNRVYLTATGLQAGITDWDIQVKPTATSYYRSAWNTSTTGQSYYDGSDFTPGDTWMARARAIYTDSSGHTVSSDWSTEYTGVLPYMDVTLKPGDGTGADAHTKGLVDSSDHNAYLTLPKATDQGISPPAAMNFDRWDTRADGTGTAYPMGQAAIPTSLGTPNGQATNVTLYAQWKQSTPTATPGNCTAGGWNTWGAPGTPTPGLTPADSRAVCWTIDNGDTLRLSGGTSPQYTSRTFPWTTQKDTIAKISIEGDLTLISNNYGNDGPFELMGNLTSLTDNHHTVTLDKTAAGSLFWNDSRLTSLYLSGWKTGTATTMANMFSGCSGLKTLTGLDHWDTSHVTSTWNMFDYDGRLTDLDLSGWDTSHVTEMSYMFEGCDSMADIDLTGWNTQTLHDSYYGGMGGLLPRNVKRLRLGPNARLFTKDSDDPFTNVDATHTWREWDWAKGHHPSDLGPVGPTSGTPGDGTLATLKTRADNHPEGVYIRDDVNPTWTDLTYNLNGGTGDTSLPAQIGQAANSGQPKRDGLAIDTTFKDGAYTTAAPTHITGNKPYQLFNGWTIDTSGMTGGTATISNHTITASKGAGGTATVTAQWTPVPEATPGTPQVTVTPRTTDQGSAGVGATATFNTAMDAITDPAKPAIAAGGTMNVCVKPSSQTADYTPGQCQAKTSTTAGSQTITPDPFTLPGSLTGGQDTTFPAPGEEYTLAATYTTHDPQTRNQIESLASQNGGGIATGTLPWLNLTFDTNDTHGGNGTPPTALQSFVDTATGKAWASLPNATGTMKPGNAVFAGWATTASATDPDAGMGDHANRNVQLPATTGATETRTTLYAVWHKLGAPTVTGIKRSALANTVTITGTAIPWTGEDDITVDLTPLDGQTGLTPAGTRHATISTTDGQGHALAYDGHTEHPWTLTLPENELPTRGRYRTDAKLEAHDYQWRDTNADLHPHSAVASTQSNLPGHHQHALPLTGGQRTMLIIALALLGVLFTAGSQVARNRRRWHHQYQ
ncbi:BspA family leucine-rich repeat surface protein [Bifidobacterium sp. ESL0769]|uniref:BspA family leucine-rich repeat surface protein n=1 Tax=Bifidobacterium sp. ESL0769 TaxID=2983229 RepID=UPI0023F6B558|nr:BspA family leucine-rich repeat surface protein [Bifidobacterium sp. ESL0769]WEV67431.1 BspA family leucine-rich repeat surface protein [Bifidobacterium sp. ESL0769]